jgi:hypothetical protein
LASGYIFGRIDAWVDALSGSLLTEKKHTDTTSETQSQPEGKGFYCFFQFSVQQEHEFAGLNCIQKQGFQPSKSTFSPRFLARKGTAEIAKIAHFIEKFGTFRAADFRKATKATKATSEIERRSLFAIYKFNYYTYPIIYYI